MELIETYGLAGDAEFVEMVDEHVRQKVCVRPQASAARRPGGWA